MQEPNGVKSHGGAVVAEDLVLARGGDVALAASSFSVRTGTLTAVVGPNGSGKTTVLHAIAGLLPPAAGRLSVLGADPALARDRVAYVLQSPKVDEAIPVTAREVVTLGRYAERGLFGRLTDEDRGRVQEAMDRLDVADLADRHLRELSAGQRQRVLVAQALAQDADVMLMDEPSTSLDIAGTAVIDEVIAAECAAGRTVLVTTHALAEAMEADHVLLLAGRVIASGPPAEVLVRSNLTEAYAGLVVDVGGAPMLLDDAAAHGHSH